MAAPKQAPLVLRLYLEPALYELARVVNYGGIKDEDFDERLKELAKAHASAEVRLAGFELTEKNEKCPGVTVLRPHVRKLCYQLLGPPPEDPEYELYYRINKRTPPENHRPPTDAPKPKARKRGKRSA
jgi:hypothetical protein